MVQWDIPSHVTLARVFQCSLIMTLKACRCNGFDARGNFLYSRAVTGGNGQLLVLLNVVVLVDRGAPQCQGLA
jgi:hypothetical protein